MNIYLSWSVVHLAVVLLLLVVAHVAAKKTLLYYKKPEYKTTVNISTVALLAVVSFIAVDVGDTKIQAYRSNFDSGVNRTNIDRVESTRPTRESVKSQFEDALTTGEEK